MPSQDNTPVSFLKYSASRRDDLMVLSTSLKMPRAMLQLSPDGAAGGDSTSRFEIGDRVGVLSGTATDLGSRMGVVTSMGTEWSHTYFTVRLANGAGSVFEGSELEIPPIVFADMIFDSHVSPVGVRGSASERRMRFICRE